jgi:hypothetical protein
MLDSGMISLNAEDSCAYFYVQGLVRTSWALTLAVRLTYFVVQAEGGDSIFALLGKT